HSSTSLARQPRARPTRASRGQNPGPRLPRATASSPHVAGNRAAARATPTTGAIRRAGGTSLLETELFHQSIEGLHLAGHPLAEPLRPHVAVGREVPFLGELLPLRRLHRLAKRVGQSLHALGRRALAGDDAPELRQ